ncbi:MAG: ABC transporter ATP-binding protein [Deltaproteobacteria bacterium]|nr:ABC transporter ATP-binding protein [Deltaproteobacteria bacterium]
MSWLGKLKRVATLLGPTERLLYLGILAAMLGGAAIDVIAVGVLPAYAIALNDPESLISNPFAARALHALELPRPTPTQILIASSMALVAVYAVKNLYSILLATFQLRVSERHRVRLATELFDRYLAADYTYFLTHNSSEILRTVAADSQEVVVGVVSPLLKALMGLVVSLGTAALLLATMPIAAFAGVSVIGGLGLGMIQLSRGRLERHGADALEKRKALVKSAYEALSVLPELRVLGREAHFSAQYRALNEEFAALDRMRRMAQLLASPVLELLAVVGLASIVLFLSVVSTPGHSVLPSLALLAGAVVRLRSAVAQVVEGFNQASYSMAAAARVADDFEALAPKAKRAATEQPLRFETALRFEDVTFEFAGAPAPALSNVTFEIKPGSFVAFVGATGAGKSTVLNLLLGLLSPTSGRITVDGRDLGPVLEGWQRRVGFVPQEVVLIDDSLERNVALGLDPQNVDPARLARAVSQAQLDTFVAALPDGLKTLVGERGIRISGGEKQRVALARALYHDPSVIVMDEGTSALDNQTESLVMQALLQARMGRTFIVVAHRLTSVEGCDTIHFLEKGRLAASGTYEELLANQPEFRQMAMAKDR